MQRKSHKSHSVQTHHHKRDWNKVIATLLKYNRSKTHYGNLIDFSYLIEKMIQDGYQIPINIPDTWTGAHDNCLKTQF